MVEPLHIAMPTGANTVVPARVVAWTRSVMKLIRCDQSMTEAFLREWLHSGRTIDGLNEGVASNFLLAKKMIDKDTWERHRRMCILKMYFGTNPRYANNLDACAKACEVNIGFARRTVQDDSA